MIVFRMRDGNMNGECGQLFMSRKLNLPYRFLFFWLDIFRLTRNDSNEESGSSFYLSPAVCSTWTLLACFSGFPCPFPIIVFVESLISIFKLSMTCVLFIICLSSKSVIYCQSRYNLFSQSPICPLSVAHFSQHTKI